MIAAIRNKIVEEAKNSPNLMADVAGLEEYISESYNSKSIQELIQNADDAGSTKILFIFEGEFLFVANDGRPFNGEDIESICRSASSYKVRGRNIGYRGIGFKSVVSYSSEVYVLSSEYKFVFSRLKTSECLGTSSRVPLIRIPHFVDEYFIEKYKDLVQQIQSEGYETIFALKLTDAELVKQEISFFEQSTLLFLNSIKEIKFKGFGIYRADRFVDSKNLLSVSIDKDGELSKWLILARGRVALAFLLNNDSIQRLPYSDSIIHSYLPTEDKFSFGFLIHADFSTEPSRKHIIMDENSASLISELAELIVSLLYECVVENKNDISGILQALAPTQDLRLLQYKSSAFEKLLADKISSRGSLVLNGILLCPSWLNIRDFSLLIQNSGHIGIPEHCYEIDGLISFLKFLGVLEATFDKIGDSIDDFDVSLLGSVQIFGHLLNLNVGGKLKLDHSIFKIKMFFVENRRLSLDQILEQNLRLDDLYLNTLYENGLSFNDVMLAFKSLVPEDKLKGVFRVVDQVNVAGIKSNDLTSFTIPSLVQGQGVKIATGVNLWRSAEENALVLLNSVGFQLEDVSKRNLGYDLEGTDNNGNRVYIEIKSITRIGEKFRLTNNEVATAFEKADSYIIVLVRQFNSNIELALFNNPLKNLKLEKQCVQWVYECSEYSYNPTTFDI
jgi:hypothetical protein